MINIYGTDDWSVKITSLLNTDEYKQYDSSNYDQAQATNPWVIALESGDERLKVQNGILDGSKFHTLFKGCDDLHGVNVGEGVTIGCCTLVRPGTSLGDQVYIGANCTIDIYCNIGDGVTIGDNVTIGERVNIPSGTFIPSGSVVRESITI